MPKKKTDNTAPLFSQLERKQGQITSVGKTETLYHLVNLDKTRIGVVSHAPNCGYTDAELKSLATKGWKIKVEVRAV